MMDSNDRATAISATSAPLSDAVDVEESGNGAISTASLAPSSVMIFAGVLGVAMTVGGTPLL